MRQVAALALLATGRALVLPANAPRTTSCAKLQATCWLNAPLDLVRSYQAEMIGQYLDDVVADPISTSSATTTRTCGRSSRTRRGRRSTLVSSFHEGLSREHRAVDVSQLRSPWGHAGSAAGAAYALATTSHRRTVPTWVDVGTAGRLRLSGVEPAAPTRRRSRARARPTRTRARSLAQRTLASRRRRSHKRL